MLAGTLLLSTVAFHLAEALQISHPASHSSTVAALRRFKSFSCTTRRDGVYPELASSCSYYYRCLDGAVFSYVCPPGQAFHYPSEECRPAGEVTCPHLPPASPPCINQSDGYYPDYRQDCKSYYRCTNSSLSGRWQCGGDGVWDSSTGSCGTGSLLVCSPPSCWGLPDGPHPAPGSSCTAYFTCAGGVRTDHVCPYNSIFDYTLKRCVAGKSSVCYEQACEGRVNGLHAVPHAPCNSFFRCFNGALVKVEECPKHQIFDGRRCVSERNFSCWGEGRGSCEGKDDGFHVSPDTDCRAFFLCHHQQFIRAYKCSPGLMFNGKECVDGRNSICNAGSPLPDCSSKIDGYYTMEKSECKTFFYCQGGSKMSEHTCPGNNVFNGEHCVDSVLFRCPSHQELQHARNFTNSVVRTRRSSDTSCDSHENGFHLDEASQCKSFFHCQNGQKDSSGTCPQQQVFNGVRCVPEEEYSCPVTSDAAECAVREDGVYQDTGDGCRSFFHCLSGVKTLFRCPEGELHDGQACRVASEVFCPPSSLCYLRDDGDFVDASRGCRGYFSCRSGTLIKYTSCGQGMLHDGRTCVSTLHHSCPTATSTICLSQPDGMYPDPTTGCGRCFKCSGGKMAASLQCPPEVVEEWQACSKDAATSLIAGAGRCRGGQEGFIQDLASGCSRYYHCSGGKLFPRQCPEGRVFDGVACVPFSQYKCPPTAAVSDAECREGDGHHAHLSSGCRTFHVCQSGRRVNHACPVEQVFNGVQCVPASQFTCPAVSFCEGRGNGWYQDFSSSCRNFFYCYNGYQHELTCPSEQIFDGHTCVPSFTYNCPNAARDNDCLGKKTGFYPDIDSSCHKYFACKNGIKVQTLRCPKKHVFNGEVCVPSAMASCLPSQAPFTPHLIATVISAALTQKNMVSRSSVPMKDLKDTSALQHLERKTKDNMEGLHSAGIKKEWLSKMCADLPNGSYAEVHSRCNSFLECGDRPRRSQCPTALVFNPINNACESPDKYTCLTTNPCQSLSDGIHADVQSQCRIFFTCLAKKVSLISSCPEGQAFSLAAGRCQSEGVSCGGTDAILV
ncbi:zonadhesin-like isoform X2 [Scylla paramamosain]|uniref:zonadhesin-like isoform X2 n=1 Tax=Scylla paramamosain TaxID=85552 RepID=UPI003082BB73